MSWATALPAPELMQEFERLREQLPAPHVAVTGARGGEGVTTVALALARVLATRGPTLLAEGNLRRPMLQQRLGARGATLADWDRAGPLPVHEWPGVAGLSVLFAGQAGHKPLPDEEIPAVLGAAAGMARSEYAHVVWDTPPLTRHPELLVLAPHIGGVLVVVEMDRSQIDELQFLRDVLARASIPILGSLLNRTGRYWPRPKRRLASEKLR